VSLADAVKHREDRDYEIEFHEFLSGYGCGRGGRWLWQW
jgi:hypothetical protein